MAGHGAFAQFFHLRSTWREFHGYRPDKTTTDKSQWPVLEGGMSSPSLLLKTASCTTQVNKGNAAQSRKLHLSFFEKLRSRGIASERKMSFTRGKQKAGWTDKGMRMSLTRLCRPTCRYLCQAVFDLTLVGLPGYMRLSTAPLRVMFA